MSRFLVSHRLAGSAEKEASRESLEKIAGHLAANTDIRSDYQPGSPSKRRILSVDANPVDLQKMHKEWGPDTLVEPEVPRDRAWSYPGDIETTVALQGTEPLFPGLGAEINVTVEGSEKSLEGAELTLVLASTGGRNSGTNLKALTDSEGHAELLYNPALWTPVGLIVEPKSGFWGRWLTRLAPELNIPVEPLPKSGPLGWWHQVIGTVVPSSHRGEGIRIGVVDTGVGPHPYLDHVKGAGAFTNGALDSTADAHIDVDEHGTHVCGIIGARPTQGSDDFGGIAQAAEVTCMRVFSKGRGASQGDVAAAIETLSTEHDVHLINLSLGSNVPSVIEQDAIRAAADEGTICVAAAGNGFSQLVNYPAAYPETVAVGALGYMGASPAGTLASRAIPGDPARLDPVGLFVANFSNSGAELDCSAPGVGIISTVPARAEVAAPYAESSGTSMAAPMVCAALATLLSQDKNYRKLERGVGRAQRASLVLAATLRSLNLSPLLVGRGICQSWPT
jgi:subtilisin family serine protease